MVGNFDDYTGASMGRDYENKLKHEELLNKANNKEKCNCNNNNDKLIKESVYNFTKYYVNMCTLNNDFVDLDDTLNCMKINFINLMCYILRYVDRNIIEQIINNYCAVNTLPLRTTLPSLIIAGSTIVSVVTFADGWKLNISLLLPS